MPIKRYDRDALIKEMKLRLGFGMVDVELDDEHYQVAINDAMSRFRQRSDNSVDESFIYMKLEPERQVYTLPDEIIEVKQIYRKSMGVGTGGQEFEPFEAQFLNNYMLNSGRAGGLAVYDALAQHRELLSRMFGGELNFTWNTSTKQLYIQRRMRAEDDVFLHVFNYKPDDVLLNDTYASPWIKDYAVAMVKLSLGEARSKFSAIAGPQGGTTLNGDALKAEAFQDFERLEMEMRNFVASNSGYGFIIG
jgi:hypothetical protein